MRLARLHNIHSLSTIHGWSDQVRRQFFKENSGVDIDPEELEAKVASTAQRITTKRAADISAIYRCALRRRPDKQAQRYLG